MKQLIFVALLTLLGTAGSFAIAPFCGVAVYYAFAVLRPQFIWQWSLPPNVQWSRYVALATIVAAVGSRLLGSPRPPMVGFPSFTKFFVSAFFGWLVLSYLLAQNREVAEPYMVEYCKIFVMLAVSSMTLRNVGQIWLLLIEAALVLAYIAFEINSVYFSGGGIAILRNGFCGLDNNGAGLMLAMGVPLCIAVWDGSVNRWRWGVLALVPVIAHAVMMTYSRGAMLSLIAAAPLIVVRSRRRWQVLSFGLIFGVLAVSFLAGPEIRRRFLTIQQMETDGSAQSRFGSWSAAIAIARDYPIFGVGVRNANLFSQRYGADMEGRTIHSQYLQIVADNGFVGLGLYLAILASVYVDTARVRRRTRRLDDPDSRRSYAIASAVETSLATFSFGGIFLSMETFELLYLVLLLGWKILDVTRTSDPARPNPTTADPWLSPLT